jgi:acyl-coenzyme A thioesterase PaaI-like protein
VIEADVRFDASHVGGRGAVHGGMVPLLFDELLGRLSNANRPVPARTAYLRTDYHRVTLPYVDYRLDGSVDEETGGKRFLSARLTAPDGVVVASAEGLFVALRDGAP